MNTTASQKGLAGVCVGETAISTVGKTGVGLSYRGYSIEDLANNCSFEEVCFLLLYKIFPSQTELDDFCLRLKTRRGLPDKLTTILQQLPASTHPMDVMRTAVSALGCLEPESTHNNQFHISERLLAVLPSVLLYWYHYHYSNKEIVTDLKETSLAGYFLHLLHEKKAEKLQQQVMNKSLILYVEHEFNASTFAARVSASTLTDFYSAVCSAIGTLRGKLHGGANEATMQLIEQFNSPLAAESGIKTALKNKKLIMGFGHRVYKNADPRSPIMKQAAILLANEANDTRYIPVAEKIEQIMSQEKKLFPNLDFYSATAYHFLAIPLELFTPVFVCSRVCGWSAHIMEQRDNNKLIRPNAEYIGSELKKFIPIAER